MSAAGSETPLWAGPRTTVRRDGGFVVKETHGPDAAARVQHERHILERLAGVDGVTRLAPQHPGEPHRLVLHDVPGRTGLRALPPPVLGRLALRLAHIVERVHAARVMHRDINPDNVVLGEPDHEPVLIDFDLATTFAEVRPAFMRPERIPGQLPYLAPEQTGRTALAVDQRADLYALGATVYAFATGRPPFPDDDPLHLVHEVLTAVPAPLAEVVPEVGVGLSDIVARLLEKDPGHRYQSAGGLAYDLSRLLADGELNQLGERDYPERIMPASLVGRTAELDLLRTSFAEAMRGRRRSVLVAGTSGVGKSTLITRTAAWATRRRGWFVSAKHDQYRQDNVVNGVLQALQELARRLLAEPERELAAHRARITGTVHDVALAAAVLPEVAALVGAEHDPAALTGTTQLFEIAIEVFRAVATPEQPVVLVLDDLQWASVSALQFVDAVVTADDLRGLFLIGAYRDNEVDAAHPLTALRERWRAMDCAPPLITLGGLDENDQITFVAELLRQPRRSARELAAVLGERCGGNPFDTTELINALRHDGVLRLDDQGWSWDERQIRRYVGSGAVVDLLAARLAELPADARRCLRVMGWLGNVVPVPVLAAATGTDAGELIGTLAPALEDGLLSIGGDDAVLGFRHDRVQQAASALVTGAERLPVARRLLHSGAFEAEAVEQYLACWEEIDEPEERRRVGDLFQVAAGHAVRVSNHATAERLLAAACAMDATGAAAPLIGWHRTLYLLGRLDEADRVYDRIIATGGDPVELTPAVSTQVDSLLNRARPADAMVLGLDWLARLGFGVPADDAGAVGHGLDVVRRWIGQTSVSTDADRPVPAGARIQMAGALLGRVSGAAFFADQGVYARLVVLSHRIWREHGPLPALASVMSNIGSLFISLRDDYRSGPRVVRHVREVTERLNSPVAAAQAGFYWLAANMHWVEDLADVPREAALMRDTLVQGGDPQHACFVYFPALGAMIDVAATLGSLDQEIDTALALAARTRNVTTTTTIMTYRRFVEAVTGDADVVTVFDDPAEQRIRQRGGRGAAHSYLLQAMAAAILDDQVTLRRAMLAAGDWIRTTTGQYQYALSMLLRVIAGLPADGVAEWFAERAEQMPANFRHLLHLVRAEQAWKAGDEVTARMAYDEALTALDTVRRPWHRALTLERAAEFHRSSGLPATAQLLLAEAYDEYEAWGATAKVRRLRDRVGRRRAVNTAGTSVGMLASDVDLLAILAASQAISSAVGLRHLHAAVQEQLCAVAGATAVTLLVRDEVTGRLDLVDGDTGDVRTPAPAEAPLSVVRYVQRTNTQLVLDDALGDERFARDPYFAGRQLCSVLAVPIAAGLLVLENTNSRGAFTGDRTDAVRLLGGQLAVSVANAILYRTLEDRIAGRTRELQNAKDEVERLSLMDTLTNVGNRRLFDRRIDATWKRAVSSHECVGLVLIDVDHFKLFNDRYGHLAGDECLRRVAEAISGAVRESDVVARYGGEEFVVLLSDVRETAVVAAVAERIRQAVENLAIPHEDSPSATVSVSAGVATAVPAPAATATDLVDAADGALYRAKGEGRNRVTLAG
ncbi:diguanylate cyclase [Actinoplanes sp. NPDC049265]|uniref:diguanylate cyclase n=1 Tax=Actinoplanes sp. NPDC049265 TaxID=3363902 RepID=UPI0037129FA1